MDNFGVGGTQVPFGDGTHVPQEVDEQIASDNINNPDFNIQGAMKNIFISCDTENTDLVAVSKLIEFISPFMKEHEMELAELQRVLDPTECDLEINSETFYNEMTTWASRLSDSSLDRVTEEQIFDTQPNEVGQLEGKINTQSSMNTNFGHNLLKGYLELGIQNVSNVSESFDISGHLDPTYFQEQIKELDHQNRKLTVEVENVRTLLSNSDDQIYILQEEIDRLSKKLNIEQQLNEQLQQNTKFSEELVESSANAKKQILRLEKSLANSERESGILILSVQKLENEKLNLEDKVDIMRKREVEAKTSVLELQSELNSKDQVISSMEEYRIQLKSQLKEQQQMLAHFTNVNEQLKMEKSKLEKNFRDAIARNTLSNQIKSSSRPNHVDSLDSGTSRCSKLLTSPRLSVPNMHINIPQNSLQISPPGFNSPKLLRMLQNPISPNISSPLYDVQSVDIDQSLFGSLPVVHTSTPEKRNFKLLYNATQSSPNKKCLFRQYKLLGTENFIGNKLSESPGINRIVDRNLNIIALDNTSDLSLDKECSKDKNISLAHSTIETSSEDEGFWKLQMVEHSPRQSLESEILQVTDVDGAGSNISPLRNQYKHIIKKLERKTSEYENIIKELVDKVHNLKEKSCEEVSNIGNELYQEAAQIKILNLESENNLKYIKIIELIEKNEYLQKCMQQINSKHADEVNKYENNIGELVCERDKLQQAEHHHQENISLFKNNTSAATPTFEELQTKSDISLEKSSVFGTNDHRLMNENSILRNKIHNLTELFYKLNKENFVLNENIEKMNMQGHTGLILDPLIESNFQLGKLLNEAQICLSESKENTELPNKFEASANGYQERLDDLGKTHSNEHKIIMEKSNIISQLEETISHHKNRIETLMNEITQVNTVNAEISRNLNEQNFQISALKELVHLQNTKIDSLNGECSNTADQLYELRSLKDQYLEEKNQLSEKLEELSIFYKYDNGDKNQFENNKNYIQISKSYGILVKEYDLMVNLKKTFLQNNKELAMNCQKFEKGIQTLEEKLRLAEQQNQEFVIDQLKSSNVIGELGLKMHSAKSEIIKLESTFNNYKIDSETQHAEEVTILQCKISHLEDLNEILKHDKDALLSRIQSVKIVTEDKGTWVGDMNSKLKGISAVLEGLEGDILCPKLTNNWCCPNCLALKIEIQELECVKKDMEDKVKLLKIEVNKRKNFERLLTRIDKLKQRIEELEMSNGQFQNEIQENLQQYTNEKDKILGEYTNLENKLKYFSDQEDKLKIFELDVKSLVDEKESVVREMSALQEKVLALKKENQKIKELEQKSHKMINDIKQVEREKMKLEQEYKQKSMRLMELEETVSRIQLDLKRTAKDKSTAIKEKTQLQIKLNKLCEDIQTTETQNQELRVEKKRMSVQHINMEKKHEGICREQKCRFQAITEENLQLLQQTQTLLNSNTELERKLEEFHSDLVKSEAKNLLLKKEFANIISTDYNMTRSNEENHSDVPQMVKQGFSKELFDLEIQLSDYIIKYDVLTEHVKAANEDLSEKRKQLSRCTRTFVNSWRSTIEKKPENAMVIFEFERAEPEIESSTIDGPLGGELSKLQRQVYLTTLLFNTLINLEISVGPQQIGSSQIYQPESISTNTLFEDNGDCENEQSQNSDVFKQDGTTPYFAEISLASPAMSDAVLENLGLLHDTDSPKWTEDEIEQKFSLLAAHFAMDIKSVSGRYRQHHEYLMNLEHYFTRSCSKLTKRLKCMKETVKPVKLKENLTIACQHLELIIKTFSKIMSSAIQCGSLKHEQRLLKCFSLIMNHSAHLSKKVETLTQQLKISSSPGCRKPNFSIATVGSNESTQSYLFNNSPTFHETNLVILETQGTSRIPWLKTFSILAFAVIFILCCILVDIHHNDNYHMLSYPWDWTSWEEILKPFIKRSYLHGPPPT